jgi:hypothetical protein
VVKPNFAWKGLGPDVVHVDFRHDEE